MQSNFFEIAYVYYVLLSLNEAEQLGLIVATKLIVLDSLL